MDRIAGLCGGSSGKSYPNTVTVTIDTRNYTELADKVKIYLRCVETNGNVKLLGGTHPIVNSCIQVEVVGVDK